MDENKITILIPTKNRYPMLKRAIHSVLTQTYHNLKIIILDNNSSDETQIFCENINDNRVIVKRSNKNLTMLENWTRGLNLIETKYFLRLDDDNFYCEDFVEKILSTCKQNNFAVTYFNDITISNGKALSRWKITDEVYNLSYMQLLKLEFLMQTDSNFCLIDFERISKLIEISEIYQTTLPDRFLIYRLSRYLKNNEIKIGLSTTPGGYALIGHQNSEVNYETVNYSNLNFFEQTNPSDASGNIYLLKIMVLKKFLEKNNDENIKKFIDDYCNSEHHYSSIAYFGHIFRLPKIKKIQDLKILIFYFFKIISYIIKYPSKTLDGKPAFKRIPLLMLILVKKIFFKENNKDINIKKNQSLADKIISKEILIDLKKLNFNKVFLEN